MKKFFLLMSFAGIFPSHADSIYKKIQWHNLFSLTWDDEEWPQETYWDYLHRLFKSQMNPQEARKRNIVFTLFDDLTSKNPEEHSALYDMTSAQDLNLLAGKKAKEPYYAEIIDRTKLEFGKVFFYGLLSTPITDPILLQERQKIIRCLLENQKLYAELNAVFDRLASSENMFLSLWNQDGFVTQAQRQYFTDDPKSMLNYFNRSTKLLELRSLFQHSERVLGLGCAVAATVILPAYGLSLIVESKPAARKAFLEKWPTLEKLEQFAQYLQGSAGYFWTLYAVLSQHAITTGIAATMAGIYTGVFCKESYEWTRDSFLFDRLLQKKMIITAEFFRAVLKLETLINAHPEFRACCPAARAISQFLKEKRHEKKMREFFALCNAGTLQGEASNISYHGNVLAAFHLLYELKETFEPLLLKLGELDAYCSCARLYNEFKDKPVQFCFAEYVEDTRPRIELEGFWNPFIRPDVVITNDLFLAGPERRNMIITGPNAGGKSTVIKAVPLNLILAQSVGLVAAKSAKVTPFYSIATYLNVVDDIAAGNSLFKAQVLRAQEMVTLVEKTPKDSFSFVALDEMFNGTSSKESKAIAYSVIKYLGQFENTICLVATHFPLLTTLEKDSNAFENYKVSVDVCGQGIHYPFKLEKGSSNQHIALDILKQEGYDSKILEDALSILKKEATSSPVS